MSAWQRVPLGDLLEVQNGYAFSSEEFTEQDGIPLIRIRDLKPNTSPPVRFQGSFDKRYLVNDGDLLIGMDGEFACYEWGGGTALLNQRVCRLVDFSDGIEPRFLLYGINKYLKEIEDKTAYTTVKHLSSKTVKGILFPLPSLDEQKRIVAVLDQAFAAMDRARANAEANLSAISEFFQRILDAEFDAIASDTTAIPLQDAVHPGCGLSYGIVQPGDEVDDGLPVVRPVDLTQREVGLVGLKRIAPDAAVGYARTTLQGGELLLCVRGSTGTLSVASQDLAGANVTRGIVPIRFDEGRVLRDFAYFQFLSVAIREQVAAKTYGAALMQINIKDLREVRFLVSDVAVQHEVVRRLEKLLESTNVLRRSYEKQLADTQFLRQSLLQAAFSGQLT